MVDTFRLNDITVVAPSTSKVQSVGHELHYSGAQLQWLIELCYTVGCHANSIHAQNLVLDLYLKQLL